ncbi:MAG: PadR family transcriptional regulator, partial [Actinomycetota bacterium]|nr:PadR family transcriptional regulator [Actinomycetota bacterium]
MRNPPGGFPFGGPPPWMAQMFGSGFGHGFGGSHLGSRGGGFGAPRARRGDVRSAILDVLSTEEMNGYQVIAQIAERTQGGWKPSPGSVYPTISQLQDEGLVESVPEGGRDGAK